MILAFNIDNPKAFTIIVGLGIILMYLAYWADELAGPHAAGGLARTSRTPRRACSRSARGLT